ncbi:hypothetical protein D3C72_1769150 [compost metagenome]
MQSINTAFLPGRAPANASAAPIHSENWRRVLPEFRAVVMNPLTDLVTTDASYGWTYRRLANLSISMMSRTFSRAPWAGVSTDRPRRYDTASAIRVRAATLPTR